MRAAQVGRWRWVAVHAALLLGACGRPLPAAPRRVAGRPSDPECAALLARLPVTEGATEGRLRVLDRVFAWRESVLVATLADPERAGAWVTLVCSGSAERVAERIGEGTDAPAPRLRVYSQGELQLEARLAGGGALEETADAEVVDHAARRGWDGLEALDAGGPRGWTVRGRPGASQALAAQVVAACEAVCPRLEWAGVARPRTLEVVLAPAAEALAGDRVPQAGARWNGIDGRLVVAEDALLASDAPRAFGAGLAVAALGAPAQDWAADAAALEATGDVWGVPLEEWCARLAAASPPGLDELLGGSDEPRSRLAVAPLRAWIWHLLRERSGEEELVITWRAGVDREQLEPLWGAELERLAARAAAQEDGEASRALVGGAGLLELGPDLARGVGTTVGRAAVERIGRAGARGVWLDASLVPRGEQGMLATREGDAAVLWGVRQARALGLWAGLAPRVLASPAGPLDAERVLTSTSDWRTHHAWQARALEHVELLAQLAGARALSLGGGLPEASRTRVDDVTDERSVRLRAERASSWEEVLRHARLRYDGQLLVEVVSAAHAREVGFLASVDGVWLPFYPEVGARGGRALPPSQEQLVEVLDGQLDRALELVFDGAPPAWLEVGFRDVPRPELGATPASYARDPEAQARAFEALDAALRARAARGASTPAGLFVRGFGVEGGERDPRQWGVEGRPALRAVQDLLR